MCIPLSALHLAPPVPLDFGCFACWSSFVATSMTAFLLRQPLRHTGSSSSW